MDKNIKFIRADTRANRVPFLEYTVQLEEDGSLNIEINQKPSHSTYFFTPTIHWNTNSELPELYTIELKMFLKIRKEKEKEHTPGGTQNL